MKNLTRLQRWFKHAGLSNLILVPVGIFLMISGNGVVVALIGGGCIGYAIRANVDAIGDIIRNG